MDGSDLYNLINKVNDEDFGGKGSHHAIARAVMAHPLMSDEAAREILTAILTDSMAEDAVMQNAHNQLHHDCVPEDDEEDPDVEPILNSGRTETHSYRIPDGHGKWLSEEEWLEQSSLDPGLKDIGNE